MTITIKSLANGATLTCTGERGEVYKFDGHDLDGLVEMLFEISNILEPGSRYSERRIQVRVVHGDKYECPAGKDCAVCRGGCGQG